MTITTTPTIEGKRIKSYLGLVTGEAIVGANIFRDLFAGLRDIVGVDLDYEVLGANNGMLMVTACGTAVAVE